MTPGNMAIVLGPNLLWTHTDAYVPLLADTTTSARTLSTHIHGCQMGLVARASWVMRFQVTVPSLGRNITEMMTTVSLQIVGIIEPIIQHADWFFPGGKAGPG